MSPQQFYRLYHGYGRFLTWIAHLAGGIFFLMMLLVAVNAVSRKVFNFPIIGMVELVEAALVVAVLLPLAFTQYTDGHIHVMLLTKRLSPGAQRILHVVSMALGCLFFVWVTWASLRFALASIRINEQVWGSIRFPIYPVKAVIPLGAALLALQFLLDTLRLALFHGGCQTEIPETSAL